MISDKTLNNQPKFIICKVILIFFYYPKCVSFFFFFLPLLTFVFLPLRFSFSNCLFPYRDLRPFLKKACHLAKVDCKEDAGIVLQDALAERDGVAWVGRPAEPWMGALHGPQAWAAHSPFPPKDLDALRKKSMISNLDLSSPLPPSPAPPSLFSMTRCRALQHAAPNATHTMRTT